LKLALGAGAFLAGCREKPRATPPLGKTKRQTRYWITILMSGGVDALYTMDPKRAADVEGTVTLPSDNTIVEGGLPLGPHYAPLARWSRDLTIINGVQIRTVNHDTAQRQFVHLKTNIADGMPSLLDVIGLHRDGQPLNTAYLNLSASVLHSPAYFGTADRFYFGKTDIFDQITQQSPEDLATLAKVLRVQATEIGRHHGWTEAEQTASYYNEVAAFLDKAARVPPLQPEQRSTDYVAQAMADSFERALWLVENDLCSGVVIDCGLLGWDTHLRNESKQAEMNGYFVRYFDELMNELRARKNAHGVLADRTALIVGSELGRFPKQNDMLGKDHMPQTSLMLSVPGLVRGKAFGRTGRMTEGQSISYQTGDLAAAGRVPVLDDLGATILKVAGVEPERYGYRGEVCTFMLDGTA
jgi:uncharacterized protein (DUF1501 family)